MTEHMGLPTLAVRDQRRARLLHDIGKLGVSNRILELSLPKYLQVDFLKIDRSVVGGLGQHGEDTAIVSAIINLAQAFGLGVVAEVIETVEQLALLREMECELGQGYRFSRPVPSTELSKISATDTTS